MKLVPLLLTTAVSLSSVPAQAAEFADVRLEDNGGRLMVVQSDGHSFQAPRIGEQDGFEMPSISADRRSVGWLALFPDRGASYSQPLYVVVLNGKRSTKHFVGDFGMPYEWCFTNDSKAVVIKYQFPHGTTPTGFDMWRLTDGRLLRRTRLAAIGPADDQSLTARAEAPSWTQCAQSASK